MILNHSGSIPHQGGIRKPSEQWMCPVQETQVEIQEPGVQIPHANRPHESKCVGEEKYKNENEGTAKGQNLQNLEVRTASFDRDSVGPRIP